MPNNFLRLVAMSIALVCALISASQRISCAQNNPQVRQTTEVAVRSVKFFGVRNKKYIEIKKWIVGQPNLLDVVCEVENTGTLAEDFVVLTSGEFIVAPKEQYDESSLKKLMDEVSWSQVTTMDDIKMEVVRHLLPGETRQVKIKGFNLSNVAKDFSRPDERLWTWLFRINVRVESRDGENLAQGQVILPLLPAQTKP